MSQASSREIYIYIYMTVLGASVPLIVTHTLCQAKDAFQKVFLVIEITLHRHI